MSLSHVFPYLLLETLNIFSSIKSKELFIQNIIRLRFVFLFTFIDIFSFRFLKTDISVFNFCYEYVL